MGVMLSNILIDAFCGVLYDIEIPEEYSAVYFQLGFMWLLMRGGEGVPECVGLPIRSTELMLSITSGYTGCGCYS